MASSHSTSLAIQEPTPLLTYHSRIDQLHFDVKQMQDELRNEMM